MLRKSMGFCVILRFCSLQKAKQYAVHPLFQLPEPEGTPNARRMGMNQWKSLGEGGGSHLMVLVLVLVVLVLHFGDYHCGYIGYTIPKKALPSYASDSCPKEGLKLKRKLPDQPEGSLSENVTMTTPRENIPDNAHDQKKALLMQEYKKLKQQCLEFEESEKELNLKVMNLKTVLEEAKKEYAALLIELQLLEKVKVEKPAKIENVNA